jgi:hypothetical protein
METLPWETNTQFSSVVTMRWEEETWGKGGIIDNYDFRVQKTDKDENALTGERRAVGWSGKLNRFHYTSYSPSTNSYPNLPYSKKKSKLIAPRLRFV